MDPVTIAGLALGIAPLIISVVENYEYTFQPFVTYRRYAREIDNFATRLAAQKAIFNNQCQILLLTAEKDGRPEDLILDNILKDSLHDSRRNEALNRRLELLLGASLTACLSILRLIQRTLDDIMRETRSFEAIPKKKVRVVFLNSDSGMIEPCRRENYQGPLLLSLSVFWKEALFSTATDLNKTPNAPGSRYLREKALLR